MSEPFTVIQFGFGAMGRKIAEVILERENLKLVGGVDIDPKLHNQQLEKLLSKSSSTTTLIHKDLQGVLKEHSGEVADVSLVITTSSLEMVEPTISESLQEGMDVVSLCEELSYPFIRHPKLSKDLDQLAKDVGKTILGTGINPGYLMDLLPTIVTAPCQQVDQIHVTRHMDSSQRRIPFQKKVGTGLSSEDFRNAIEKGTITGHVGLVESIHIISDALQLNLDHVEEFPPEPVIATSKTETPYITVDEGNVLGLKSKAVGQKKGKTIIELSFEAFAGASPQYDEVQIKGIPNVRHRIEGGMHGDHGTVGMIVNMIPLVVLERPGLLTMKDISCPRNTQNLWKYTD